MRRLTLGAICCLVPLSLLGCEDPDALVTGTPGKTLKPAVITTTGPSGSLTDGDPVATPAPTQDWSSGGSGTPPPPELSFTPTPQRTTDGTSSGGGSSLEDGGDGFLDELDGTPGDGGGTVSPDDPGANDNVPGDIPEPDEGGSDPDAGEGTPPDPSDPLAGGDTF